MIEKMMIMSYAEGIAQENIKAFTMRALVDAPDAFWVIPASSTGKHHPKLAQGEGGLIRHTLAALYFGRDLCIAYGVNKVECDIVKAALILHDVAKAIAEPHDIVYATKLRWYTRGEYDHPLVHSVIDCVRWHMGRWATGSTDCQLSERGPKEFPRDFSVLERIVHLADYAASRKRVDLLKLEA